MAKTNVKIQRLVCLALIATSCLISTSLPPRVSAAMTIVALTPSSGSVGASINVVGNLTTSDGGYEVFFDQMRVANGTATANLVNASFIVPQAIAGNHTVMIGDISVPEDNATATFTVTTSYLVEIPEAAKRVQEGDSVPFSAAVTGGQANTTIVANITILAPSNLSYTKMIDIVTSEVGNGSGNVNYPNDFPSGANTSFVGDYKVFFNSSTSANTFSTGLTNATQYHRNQTVNIKAVYEPSENVTLTITGKDLSDSLNLTDASGMILYDWLVPLNASIGTYAVTIASIAGPTHKNPIDTQSFVVPGYTANVTTRNLAEDPVPSANVRAFENQTLVANTTTLSGGLTTLKLEMGSYLCQGYFKGEKVGELSIEITDDTAFDFFLNLTNLGISVVSIIQGVERGIPAAEVYLTPNNETFATNLDGAIIVNSLLPNASYELNATRYGVSFNISSIPTLLSDQLSVAWYNLTIACPILTLQVTVTKSDGQPFHNSVVKVQDIEGAPVYEMNSDASGSATFFSALGKYTVYVYDESGVLLNETSVDLFQDKTMSINAAFYGLTLSVNVVDYFGQSMANVNVEVRREGQLPMTEKTHGDGSVTFNNLVGGDVQLTLYLSDLSQPIAARGLTVTSSMSTQVKVDRYTVLAGMLVETSQLAVVIVIVLVVLFLLAMELYRIRRSRSRKSETETLDK